jgi:uracil-DNA glycosylase
VLGAFGWQALLPVMADGGWQLPRPRPAFGHGTEVQLGALHLVGCYHPSQRNMNTGTLTRAMLREALGRGAELAGLRVR